MSDMTRRVFLGQAGVAAVTAAGTAVGAEKRSGVESLAEQYRPFVGETFHISPDGKTWSKCVLDEMEDLGSAPRSWLPKPVSLMFSTGDGVSLPQDNYILAHNRLPARRLLIAPVGMKQRLQTIFA